MLSENKKRMVVAICAEEEISSIEWARLKKDKWVNRSISCPEYVQRIYKMMNWNKDCRYKVYGRLPILNEGWFWYLILHPLLCLIRCRRSTLTSTPAK